MAKPKSTTINFLLRGINRNMWKRFRMICLENQVTAVEQVRQLINDFVAENEEE